MLVVIFKALLLTSVVGALLAAVLMLFRTITKKYFSAGWHYYMWLAVLLVMVLPVKFRLPEEVQLFKQGEAEAEGKRNVYADEHAYRIIRQYIETEAPVRRAEVGYIGSRAVAMAEFVESKLNIISSTWVIVSVVLLAAKVVGYLRFYCRLMEDSEELLCPEIKIFTKRKVIVKKSSLIHSPIMMGVLRPMLVLPDMELTAKQLKNVLAHEMTHFKRHDIAYKWFITLVKCVHWFNPVVYFVVKQVNLWCEISCDLAVVWRMDKEEKLSYVDTILALISTGKSKNIPLTTGMLGSKEALKRRFLMIKNKSVISKKAKIISSALAAALLVGTLGVSGVMANDMLGSETTDAVNESYIETEVNNEAALETAAADVVCEAENTEEVKSVSDAMTIDTAADKAEVKGAELEVVWPCPASDNVAAGFVTRVHPVTGETIKHNGIDIVVKTGTDIVAAIGGKVTLAGWDRSNGYTIVISNGNTEVMYAHLSDILVEKGDTVTIGQLVAKSGSTGMSTGPHLHFEIKINDEYVDPQKVYQ